MAKKRGPKRNSHQRSLDLNKASKLRESGASLRQIADQMDISHHQVRLDLAFIDKQLIQESKETLEQHKINQIAKLRWGQIQAVLGWNKSLSDAEKHTVKHTFEGVEESHTVEGQSGNPAHIRNYFKSLELESKLLGLFDTGGQDPDELSAFEEALVEELKKAGNRYAETIPTEPGPTELSDPEHGED